MLKDISKCDNFSLYNNIFKFQTRLTPASNICKYFDSLRCHHNILKLDRTISLGDGVNGIQKMEWVYHDFDFLENWFIHPASASRFFSGRSSSSMAFRKFFLNCQFDISSSFCSFLVVVPVNRFVNVWYICLPYSWK